MTTNYFKPHFPILVLLLTSTCFMRTNAAKAAVAPPLPPPLNIVTVTIEVKSALPQPVSLDCKAELEVLPQQTLKTGGVYQFKYTLDFNRKGATYAFCRFRTVGRDRTFLVWSFGRDIITCAENLKCSWTIKPDGFYEFYNNKDNLEYSW